MESRSREFSLYSQFKIGEGIIMDILKILPKGKLIKYFWEGAQKKRDVSNVAYRYLFQECIIDKKVTLRDIFLLMNHNPEIFDLVFGNWCKDFLKEALNKKSRKKDSSIEYLELYWHIHKDKDYETKKPTFAGYNFPRFHGRGRAKKTEHGHKKGQWVNWSLSFIPSQELMDIPVKLEEKTFIYDEDNWKNPPQAMGKPIYTLGHILYAIIWELSFHGPPKKRDKTGKELLKRVKDVKSGKVKTIPFDIKQFLKDLKKKKKKKKTPI